MRWTWGSWLVLSFVAGGCAPLDLTAFNPRAPALSRILPEAPGAACEFGGRAVQTGLDLDGNAVLGDAEVTRTEYVCAAAPASVLVRTSELAPGAVCLDGGRLTQVGLDLDGNGVLDDAEVTREVPACTRAAAIVTRTRPVTASTACLSSATVLEAGDDVDGDGVLDTAEVQASHHFCLVDSALLRIQVQPEPAGGACGRPGMRVEAFGDLNGNGQRDPDTEALTLLPLCQPARVYSGGPYVVATAEDLAGLQGVTRVDGDLIINSETLTDLALPELSVVMGALSIQANPQLTRAALPGLRFAGEVLLADNTVLSTASLGGPAGQVHVDQNLTVRGNPALLSLEGLRTLTPRRWLGVADNALLETFEFPWVDSLPDGLSVQGNPRLRTLSLPFLETAGSVVLIQNVALESLSGLAALRTVEHLDIFASDALTTLQGLDSLLSASSITIVRNAKLQTTAGFPRLIRAGAVTIGDNVVLESTGGMPELRTVSELFTLRNNARLKSVTGLENLDSVHTLLVELNPRLTDLGGFGRLLRLDRLSVRYNNDLRELSRLQGLRQLQFLVVTDNPSLEELGLNDLQVVGGWFNVANNPLLPACRARELADRVYLGMEMRVISGNDDAATCDAP
ncbi:putative lipoprotein [Corallococcus coralloides DSM 2259]|uniref:Putative lipoprotein n=1 Tax=Corallococcus coralloides (strain ATCC 25202 / DSM 2259 / NBRC 100086 / M2) TaxID=1144275 RepID=H8MNZ5_CORCM|nr:leucine-rich repeat domain-containing protein [Corallococcus coralloides]AFE07560.1 putative lipoprotein [Corallococcus coralloides DSM 2259]